MKLRLTQAGFETYTGQMGVVMFKDGVSETDVLPIDAIRISAAIGAEWEDGTAANVGEMYLNNMHSPAHVGGNDINEMSMPVEGTADKTETQPEGTEVVSEVTKYTEESLAAIADKEGIAGLRTVADSLSVKGTSIVGLIAGIMKAQAAKTGE